MIKGGFVRMDFSSVIDALYHYFSQTPVFTPIIPLIAIFLVYIINKKYFWTVPKIALGLSAAIAIYEIITKVPEGDIFDRIKTYFLNSDISFGFYFIFLSIFIYSFVIAIVFSIFDMIRNKIEVRINKLPR
jgi:hypothetical protein